MGSSIVDGKWLIKKLFLTLLITVACCVLACKCTLTCCSLVPFHSFLPSSPSIAMSGNIPDRMIMLAVKAFGQFFSLCWNLGWLYFKADILLLTCRIRTLEHIFVVRSQTFLWVVIIKFINRWPGQDPQQWSCWYCLHCHVIMLNFMWPFIGYTGLRIMLFRTYHGIVFQKNRTLGYVTVKTSGSHTLAHFPGDDCDYSHGAEDWNCVECYLFISFLQRYFCIQVTSEHFS